MFTKEDFEKAYNKALKEIMDDPEVKGDMKFILPLTGSLVVSKLKKYLFNEEG